MATKEDLQVAQDLLDTLIANKDGCVGMKVFLLTDCLINKDEEDIAKYPNGSFDELMEYVKTL